MTKNGITQRFVCKFCGKVFSDSYWGPFYNIRTGHDRIFTALELFLEGESINRIAAAVGSKPQTITKWLSRSLRNKEYWEEYITKHYVINSKELRLLWKTIKLRAYSRWGASDYVQNKGVKMKERRSFYSGFRLEH